MLSFLVFLPFSPAHQAVLVRDLQNMWVNHSFDIQVWGKEGHWRLLRLWPGELAHRSRPCLGPRGSCGVRRQIGERRCHPAHYQWIWVPGWAVTLSFCSSKIRGKGEPWKWGDPSKLSLTGFAKTLCFDTLCVAQLFSSQLIPFCLSPTQIIIFNAYWVLTCSRSLQGIILTHINWKIGYVWYF